MISGSLIDPVSLLLSLPPRVELESKIQVFLLGDLLRQHTTQCLLLQVPLVEQGVKYRVVNPEV